MNDRQVREKLAVGIIGATGSVGQKFLELLDGHPWFEVTALAASDRSAGLPYAKAVQWRGKAPIPASVRNLTVEEAAPGLDCALVFSALPSSEAGPVERDFADAGYAVVSNAASHRMAPDVPLVVPEVNGEHLSLIERQLTFREGGFIVTNPNCSTAGLVCTLKPIQAAFGIRSVYVATLQALSGAGYPGVPSLDAIANVIPYIPNEEHKLESEPNKILGRFVENRLHPASFDVSAQCTRVPVVDGHTLCVSVRLMDVGLKPAEVAAALENFETPEDVASLPSAPSQLIEVLWDDDAPQPRKHVDAGGGMTVSVGRIRKCPVWDVKYVALVHNTVRGAAGGAILNAELLVARGYLSAG